MNIIRITSSTFGLAVFSRLAKKLKKTNWIKLVREERKRVHLVVDKEKAVVF